MRLNEAPYGEYQRKTAPVVGFVLLAILLVDFVDLFLTGPEKVLSSRGFWADLISIAILLPATLLMFSEKSNRRFLASLAIFVIVANIGIRAKPETFSIYPDMLHLIGLALTAMLVAYEVLGLFIVLLSLAYLIVGSLTSGNPDLVSHIPIMGFLLVGIATVSTIFSRSVRHNLKQIEELSRERELRNNAVRETDRAGSLGLLAARMAHEMHTPLGTAYTAATFLRDNEWGPDSPQMAELSAAMIGKSIETLRRLRSMAPIEESLTPNETDIMEIIKDSVCEVPVLIDMDEDSPMPSISVEDSGPCRVSTHESVIRRVLQELIANAVLHAFPLFSDKERGNVVLSLDDKPDHVGIRVMDDGIGGIGNEAMEPMTGLMDGAERLGLGLATVSLLVRQVLRGRLSIGPGQNGKGTAVEISIPKIR